MLCAATCHGRVRCTRPVPRWLPCCKTPPIGVLALDLWNLVERHQCMRLPRRRARDRVLIAMWGFWGNYSVADRLGRPQGLWVRKRKTASGEVSRSFLSGSMTPGYLVGL